MSLLCTSRCNEITLLSAFHEIQTCNAMSDDEKAAFSVEVARLEKKIEALTKKVNAQQQDIDTHYALSASGGRRLLFLVPRAPNDVLCSFLTFAHRRTANPFQLTCLCYMFVSFPLMFCSALCFPSGLAGGCNAWCWCACGRCTGLTMAWTAVWLPALAGTIRH